MINSFITKFSRRKDILMLSIDEEHSLEIKNYIQTLVLIAQWRIDYGESQFDQKIDDLNIQNKV
ncbi:hypothetical protein [Sphingobacterium spiritivorum]|uniref:Uncharacterized protein n=1 Tax=Sphingobacterium spiritivorum ATCC 33861 TaxID=525373 RepID=D7VTL8_SPHSI|nr:hypothetical protein [Sphingobacterium spiritivorum]EFK55777.1 hypothetical protein HMPREF0766_14338 [Sphingobacterium spiritivorum ATCC 33861]QQT37312.1 hypothetical protein I6J01_07875 [Sphingobacterium spiritivorum]WQD34098.1 hypothetical protein U0038_21590 [Sphingobacterium spiritivorum]SUJ29541.1 Uncharacterised protein [Sphingobacterium spiritivorum]